MIKRRMAISTILLMMFVILIIGMSLAWFSSSKSKANELKFGTVKIELLEPGFNDISDAQVGTYEKNIMVRSLGTKKTYVRVRLVPEWSEPSLPISNVEFNLASDKWVYSDGYYYYKRPLTENQETELLLDSVTIVALEPEYEGETLTIKAVAEASQATHEAWKNVWGIISLPFTPEE